MQKRTFTYIITGLLSLLMTSAAMARDKQYVFQLEDALSAYTNSKYYSESISIYFGDSPHPQVEQVLKTQTLTKRTSRRGDTTNDQDNFKREMKMCHLVFIALIAVMKKQANQLGADAIVNIQSNFKDKTLNSQNEYECYEGTFHGAIAFSGDYVTFK